MITLGAWQLRIVPRVGLGLTIDGVEGVSGDYVNDVLLAGATRELFLALIDREGLVVCRHVGGDDRYHRDVRGRSSKGRLSQGEYYHQDGCAGPVKPRVVEIRCPYQETPRHIATAVAPFAQVVEAMLLGLPRQLRSDPLLAPYYEAGIAPHQRDHVQGLMNRMLRRRFSAEDTRAFFRDVDAASGAHREPWELGESRFIANASMQHRRAYLRPHMEREANGRLMKRWPDGPDEDVCLIAPAA